MIIDINKKMLNSIVKLSLQISIELYNSGQNSFMKMSEYFNLYDFNYNSLSDSACAFTEQKKSGHYIVPNDTSLRMFHTNRSKAPTKNLLS